MHFALENLRFDNRFSRELPEDPIQKNEPRQVRNACFSRVAPTHAPKPQLIALSPESAALLHDSLSDVDSETLAAILSGNRLLAGMTTYSTCYGGHQFGNWAGQLGDGRAISLGEVLNVHGERWEMQLKGAGPTPYSRSADGYAVMRSSVREFLASEAMYHLGVPTTRALSLVATGATVIRDMFYDGHPRPEPGAIVCRLAPSFIRFGNFEILAAHDDHTHLKCLADHTIQTHYPHLGQPGPETYARWLAEICQRSARTINHWMRVGFVHGVMNTDNMSILGLTIDYGPYGWLEGYDPLWTPNTTDASGRRYAFGNQPHVAGWNLLRLANALFPLVGDPSALEGALRVYPETFVDEERLRFAQKLGLGAWRDSDSELVTELEAILKLVETDMTIFYRRLANVPSAESATDDERLEPLMDAYYDHGAMTHAVRSRTSAWLRRYTARIRQEGVSDRLRRAQMNTVNPKYVLRNYLAQLAIDQAEKNDGSMVEELLAVMRAPYDEQPGKEAFATKRPEWARNRPGASMLSCSS